MNDFDPTSQSSAEPAPATLAVKARRPHARRLLSKKTGGLILAAGLTCAVAGLAGGTSASAASVSPLDVAATPTVPAEGGPVADPSEGGSTGIVDTKTTTGFTFTTATGVVVTADVASTTTYTKGTDRTTAKAVKEGESVLVLGTVDSSTITATQVIVQPKGDGGVAAATAAGVIAFEQGAPSPDKSVGEIPAYTEGEGTILAGTTADKAVKAAQAVVPGGVMNRVVELSGGEYEVHNVGVNWPHHVFVSKDFKVLGWE
ncbi:hypothetical protein ACFYPC_19480 [Streptomyces sp. NPDC005808]|uniref:hypothetical protein n=1 Tax=Streptomyces sp. NPDC005808 TaxID=3364734 RepID=UPI0036C371B2